MPKAASPIRLQQALMQSAKLTGKRFHRSTAEQIEYWAELGRRLSSTLDPDVLLSVTTGLAKLTVEPVISEPVEPDQVFTELEQERDKSLLTDSVSTSVVRYQVSNVYPGYLERIDASGDTTVGKFIQGVFVVKD